MGLKLELKLITYNIHKGFTFQNTKFVLNEIREAVRQEGADLLFLQEVLGDHVKHEINDFASNAQFEYLADSLWDHFAYGRNAVYSAGHHGNAILSKYPLRNFENHDISTNRFESRGVLHAELEVEELSRKIHVFCLHLDLLEKGRAKQLEQLASLIDEKINHEDTVFVCGDFNDWRQNACNTLVDIAGMSEAFKTVTGDYARSFPSFWPVLKVDRIYYKNAEPVEVSALEGIPFTTLSDHIALKATFKISD